MILDLWHDEAIDQSETLTFEVPFDDLKAYLIVPDYEVDWRGRWFYVDEIEDNRNGDEVRKRATCNARWYRLNDTTYVGSLNLVQQTTEDGLTAILAGSDWTVDPTTTSSSTTYSLELQDKTLLYLIREWAKVTGTFVEWNTADRTVALVSSRGEDRGVSFRYRRNLRAIRRRTRPPEATVLYPYGAQGLNIAGVNAGVEYLEDFTYYTDQGLTIGEARDRFTRSRVWSDPTFIVDADLLAAAQVRMTALASGLVSYEMEVVTLSDLTGVSEPVFIGDTVLVADELLGANIDTTVVRRRTYPLQPWRDEIELGTLQDVLSTSSPTSREQNSNDWVMFVHDNLAAYIIRNDGNYILNRLPLNFRPAGQAHWHLDFFATGVGAGTLVVEVFDAITTDTVYRTLRVPYTDGAVIHESLQWAELEREGQYDYRVRFTTEASGGPDAAKGVNIEAAESRFFVLALGAVQQAPSPGDDSVTFTYTGALQTWDIPDDVTSITITAKGAQGGGTVRAGGGVVTATIDVTPGDTLDIYVGGSTTGPTGGWPDGGNGDSSPGSDGFGGGGSTRVIPAGGALSAALVVAAGGGGSGDDFTGWAQTGGGGGFFVGAPGVTGAPNGGVSPGGGATQHAGGAGGTGASANGTAGSSGAGGAGGNATLGTHFPPGGGGGGWYGGGGGGVDAVGAGNCGGGGGGSGHVVDGAYDLTFEDGTNAGDGEVTITWELP